VTSNVENEFDLFGKRVIKQARTNLSKKKINATKDLYNSMKYETKVFPSGALEFNFFMEDYWRFVDDGVRGVGGTKANGERWKVKKSTGRFKYRDKKPPAKVFEKWIKAKPVVFRNKKGQFITRKQASFIIANAVYHQGIEQTDFFRRSFELAYQKLPDDIIRAYANDLDRLLEFTVRR
jgi:hypothetical protein